MRIAGAQLNYKIGDFEGNYQKIANIIKQYSQKADVIVFTELCLSGYYPRDLILQPAFIKAQNEILHKIQALTKEHNIAVVIGLVSLNKNKGKPYYNSLYLIQGDILYTYHKRLLPMYNIFNEARHFAADNKPGIFEFQNKRFGFLICEDGWADLDMYPYESDPVNDLMNQNLDVIICINGSPSNIGKQTERIQHFSAIAKRCKAPLMFTNQVGGNDDIVFDGASFIVDKEGKVQGSLKQFEEDSGLVTLEKTAFTHLQNFSLSTPISHIELFYHQIILGLKDYVEKCGFKSIVIGESGGIDSALTTALAVLALGSDKVHAIAMPSRYSSTASVIDAKALCDNLNVKLHVISIEEEFSLATSQFTQAFSESPSSLTEQNIQARLRGRMLMEYSNQTGALVLSTGNKSEISVGYTTLYGDMTGGFNIIGDLYKTEVYALARYFNQLHPDTPIPENILTKAPSAELAPDQKDTDSLPPYDVLDPILKLYIEGDLLSSDEIKKYSLALDSLSPSLIAKVHEMVDFAEFKRRQSAPIVRVQRRAFGYGRQLPIAASYPKPSAKPI